MVHVIIIQTMIVLLTVQVFMEVHQQLINAGYVIAIMIMIVYKIVQELGVVLLL